MSYLTWLFYRWSRRSESIVRYSTTGRSLVFSLSFVVDDPFFVAEFPSTLGFRDLTTVRSVYSQSILSPLYKR